MINLEGLVYYIYVSDPIGNEIITDTTDVLLSFNEGVVSSGMNYGEFAEDFQKSPGGWFPYLHISIVTR